MSRDVEKKICSTVTTLQYILQQISPTFPVSAISTNANYGPHDTAAHSCTHITPKSHEDRHASFSILL